MIRPEDAEMARYAHEHATSPQVKVNAEFVLFWYFRQLLEVEHAKQVAQSIARGGK